MWQLAIMGYTAIIKRVQVKPSGDQAIYLEVRAKEREVQSMLRLAARMIKSRTRHLGPRPGDLPPLPDAGVDADSDAGDVDAGDQGQATLWSVLGMQSSNQFTAF